MYQRFFSRLQLVKVKAVHHGVMIHLESLKQMKEACVARRAVKNNTTHASELK